MKSGRVTDLFMRAIEQLASESTEVRIGAIFALEQIAGESLRDRPHIVTILAVLVRNRLPGSQVREGQYVLLPLQRAPDAQVALTVLCRKPLSDNRRQSCDIGGLDLTHTDLRRANLACANLRNANLWGAHLEGADLRGADLSDADLGDANFDSFMPSNPDFQYGTDIRRSDLSGAQLRYARNLGLALTEGALANSRTTWPEGFDWRAAGVKRKDGG
jgi:uncharacterized protein YjbI with pentapeptide repeats